MSRLDAITQQRMRKLERLRSQGIDPYPSRYHRSHTNLEAIGLFEKLEHKGQSVPEMNLAGRITATRRMGKLSFLDLRDDIRESAAEGKQLVLIWEQRGCPYCREMHRVNLRIPAIVDYIKANFNVVQLNLWGDREVVDVDGEVTTEKKLARKYRVQFTPTLQFFPKGLPEGNKKPGHEAEVWRLMGYWKPFHFHYSFVYVHELGYQSEPNFQRWLQLKADQLRAEGKEVKLW